MAEANGPKKMHWYVIADFKKKKASDFVSLYIVFSISEIII